MARTTGVDAGDKVKKTNSKQGTSQNNQNRPLERQHKGQLIPRPFTFRNGLFLHVILLG